MNTPKKPIILPPVRRATGRLVDHWVYGGFLSSFVLLACGIVFLGTDSLLMLLLFLHLPAYQIHQWEEHDNDRFRTYANREIGKGREILTPGTVFVVNIFAVWAFV